MSARVIARGVWLPALYGIGDGASLVMITHRAPESAMAAAIGMISGLGFVRGEPRAIRVFDEEDA